MGKSPSIGKLPRLRIVVRGAQITFTAPGATAKTHRQKSTLRQEADEWAPGAG